jgi:hypothetical protein
MNAPPSSVSVLLVAPSSVVVPPSSPVPSSPPEDEPPLDPPEEELPDDESPDDEPPEDDGGEPELPLELSPSFASSLVPSRREGPQARVRTPTRHPTTHRITKN